MYFRWLFILVLMIGSTTASIAGEPRISHLSKKLQSELTSSGLWQTGCPVAMDDLRLISMSYYDYQGHPHHDGRMILHQSAAQSALHLFDQLYLKKYPFSTIETLIKYKGDKKMAEEHNLSYGFVCQRDASNAFIPESWGTVVTINPVFNPEVKMMVDKNEEYIEISPTRGIFSVNRKLKLNGMSESVNSVFSQNHFTRLELATNQVGWKKFIFVKNIPIKQTKVIVSSIVSKKDQINHPAGIFTAQSLTNEMMSHLKKNSTWHEGCPVPLSRLSLLTLSYYDFNDQVHTGTLIVFDAIAPYILSAFQELYKQHYPLEVFDIASTPSDTNENTSGFNCRSMVGKTNYSVHSYGLALDVNVSRNPYIGAYTENASGHVIGSLIPFGSSGLSYLMRNQKRPGMNEAIVKTMAKYGLIEWGGNWQDRIDYMHFQVPTNVAIHLVQVDRESAAQLINLIIKYPESAKHMSADTRWDYLYTLYPKQYMTVMSKYFNLLKDHPETQVINLIYRDLAMTPAT